MSASRTLATLALLIYLPLANTGLGQISGCSSTGIWYTGDGTYYGGVAGSSGGHCSLAVPAGDVYHAALNTAQYSNSSPCGSCVRILGPAGEVTVKIVDECPSCAFGDIDLAMGAFPLIANPILGRVKIKWQYVTCPKDTTITIRFDAGSNPYYFKAQFSNSRYPISKLEYRKSDGTYADIQRVIYNYFVDPTGIDADKSKTGPYVFRITASTQEMLDTDSIYFSTTHAIDTKRQFTSLHCNDCAGTMDGLALLDLCGVCAGGNTGIALNSSCTKDCAGVWEGTAYLDGCGTCVSGTTGRTPCGLDCNQAPGGSAYLDRCGTCVGGNTGKLACTKDCANTWGGKAFADSCGTCAGGNTGKTPITLPSLCHPISETTPLAMVPELQVISPFEEKLQVITHLPIDTILLHTVLGNLVLETHSTKTNTSSLPPGLYLCTIYSNHHKTVLRVVK